MMTKMMENPADAVAFDRATDGLLGFFTPEQARALIAYRGEVWLQGRIEELAGKNTEGELTVDERAEYEGYVRANRFVAILQGKLKKLLAVS
jgi:hypothetical protein